MISKWLQESYERVRLQEKADNNRIKELLEESQRDNMTDLQYVKWLVKVEQFHLEKEARK